jgi:hypothetical protein
MMMQHVQMWDFSNIGRKVCENKQEGNHQHDHVDLQLNKKTKKKVSHSGNPRKQRDSFIVFSSQEYRYLIVFGDLLVLKDNTLRCSFFFLLMFQPANLSVSIQDRALLQPKL